MDAPTHNVVVHAWTRPAEGQPEITMWSAVVVTKPLGPGAWMHHYRIFGGSDLTVGASTGSARERPNRFLGRVVSIESDCSDDQKYRLEGWMRAQLGPEFEVRDPMDTSKHLLRDGA